MRLTLTITASVCATLACAAPCDADTEYLIDDGRAEIALGADPGEDLVWLNTFDTDPGASIIDEISLSWGRPGGVSSLNTLTATLLIYDDPTAGSPDDASLVWSGDVTIRNANLPIIRSYAVPLVEVSDHFAVGVIFRNTSGQAKFIASLDLSAPAMADRSYIGFGFGVDPADLTTIPQADFGAVETYGFDGNFVLRAHGVPTPGAGAAMALGVLALARRRRAALA